MPKGPAYVKGDYNAPPSTRLPGGVVATGIVVLGDRCVSEGDVVGARGVVLGDEVVVHGNIFSGGPVLLGAGFHVDGQINPAHAAPFDAPPEEPQAPVAAAHDRDLLRSAIAETLSVLLEVAWDDHREGRRGYPDSWWGLDWESTGEVIAKVIEMIEQAYAGGADKRPWSTDDVFGVLLKQVVPLVLPVSVTRTGPDSGLVKMGPPTRVFDQAQPRAGWPFPAVALLTLLGNAVRPGFRVRLIGDTSILGPTSDPDEAHAVVSIGPLALESSPK